MAAKLRPHQREGVTFMFHRISGLAKGGYTGAVLMDGMVRAAYTHTHTHTYTYTYARACRQGVAHALRMPVSDQEACVCVCVCACVCPPQGLGKTFQSICAMWTLLNTGERGLVCHTRRRPLGNIPSACKTMSSTL